MLSRSSSLSRATLPLFIPPRRRFSYIISQCSSPRGIYSRAAAVAAARAAVPAINNPRRARAREFIQATYVCVYVYVRTYMVV